jgi:hypothetical protein
MQKKASTEEEQKDPQAQVDTQSTEQTPQDTSDNTGDTKEQTIADAVSEKKQSDTVPLATYMSEKKQRQELQAKYDELQSNVESNKTSTGEDMSAKDIEKIAEDMGIDAESAKKFANAIGSKTSADVEEMKQTLAQIQQKEESSRVEKVLNQFYKEALENSPEFKDVANKQVVMQLAQMTTNQGKTMTELLNETYGSVANKATSSMESSSSNAKASPKVDFSKLREMSADEQSAVLKDPEQKKQYNDYLIKNLNL